MADRAHGVTPHSESASTSPAYCDSECEIACLRLPIPLRAHLAGQVAREVVPTASVLLPATSLTMPHPPEPSETRWPPAHNQTPATPAARTSGTGQSDRPSPAKPEIRAWRLHSSENCGSCKPSRSPQNPDCRS